MPGLSRVRSALGAWRYAVALAIVGLALSIRLALSPSLEGYAFLTFFPAVTAAAVVGGWRAGAVATAASIVAAWFVLLPPAWSFALHQFSEAVALAGFAASCALIVFLVALLEQEERAHAEAAERANLLFRELKHRVGNVLQLAIGLLRLRGRDLDDKAREALDQAAAQLQLIGEVHDRIAGAEGNVRIDEPLRELCSRVVGTLPGRQCRVRCDRVVLPRDMLIPLALAIHELIMNALEHGFAGRDAGSLDVSVAATADGGWRIEIVDDGCGLPPNFDAAAGPRQGLKLVAALVQQAGGTFVLANRTGAAGAVARIDIPTARLAAPPEAT